MSVKDCIAMYHVYLLLPSATVFLLLFHVYLTLIKFENHLWVDGLTTLCLKKKPDTCEIFKYLQQNWTNINNFWYRESSINLSVFGYKIALSDFMEQGASLVCFRENHLSVSDGSNPSNGIEWIRSYFNKN